MLTLIRGIPGSGKSTLARLLAERYEGMHFEADHFFTDRDGNYNWDRNKIREAHAWCQEQTEKYLQMEVPVIVSNTFTTIKELKPYFAIAAKFDLVPSVIVCQNDWGNLHDVPADIIANMKARFEYNIQSLFEGKK
jgi:predicted kinase